MFEYEDSEQLKFLRGLPRSDGRRRHVLDGFRRVIERAVRVWVIESSFVDMDLD